MPSEVDPAAVSNNTGAELARRTEPWPLSCPPTSSFPSQSSVASPQVASSLVFDFFDANRVLIPVPSFPLPAFLHRQPDAQAQGFFLDFASECRFWW